jgi:hypothetical protein
MGYHVYVQLQCADARRRRNYEQHNGHVDRRENLNIPYLFS